MKSVYKIVARDPDWIAWSKVISLKRSFGWLGHLWIHSHRWMIAVKRQIANEETAQK